jgi:3-dehydroquinate synthase
LAAIRWLKCILASTRCAKQASLTFRWTTLNTLFGINMRKIFLYGPPGSGKSTLGKLLAQNLNLSFIDTDAEIVSLAGKPISQLMAERGESALRDLESDVIEQVCSNSPADVVALGGGSLLRDKNRLLVEAAGDVIFLDIGLDSLLSRLSPDESQRPLLAGDPVNKIKTLLEKRKEHYASFEIRVTNIRQNNPEKQKTPEEMAWEIQQKLGIYHVRGMGQGYDVIVEQGGLDKLGQMLKERGLSGSAVIVSDTNIAPLYADRVMQSLTETGFSVRVLTIPAGEEHKTLETVANMWRAFLEAGLDRQSIVVALGGGVVGDLAGFAAATFMRGCQWVAAPTTLLSMVDASMGGKTGFDLPEGKNLVGAFYPPRLVLADPQVLSTLPEQELVSGLAEVVKHGIISDPELFDLCAQGLDAVKADLPEIVRRAMGVKVQVIEQDPFEKGIRAALNLGHTVGHAVEIVSRFQLRHGEAIAIGLVAEAKLAEKMGLTEASDGLSNRIKTVLTGLCLPTEIPADLPVPAIIQSMRVDKKKERHVVKFALPIKIGKVQVGVAVTDLEGVLA